VTVDAVERSRIWIAAPDLSLEVGEEVLIEHSVVRDARYQATLRVGSQVKQSFSLELPGQWNRIQERASVRVMTDRFPVQGIWPDHRRARVDLTMLDLGIGGMRVETSETLEAGDSLDFRFRLPDCPILFTVSARVARVLEKELRSGGRLQVGLRFEKLEYPIEAALTRWIFDAQVKRHHTRKDEKKGQRR
jgi:c-di-GMP-binding flagellar brake protein YcgR